jgi:hypothetical protein
MTNNPESFDQSTSEEFTELVRVIMNFCDSRGPNVASELKHITKILETHLNHRKKFLEAINDISNFPTLNQIEQMMLDLRTQQDALLLDFVLDNINRLNRENDKHNTPKKPKSKPKVRK